MKKLKNILIGVYAIFLIGGCNDDEVNFSFQELRNEDYDLAVVSEAVPYVEAAFSVTGNLETISASITAENGSEPVGAETISNFTGNSFNRVNIEIPFPTPNIAPSGLYTINYTIETSDGDQDGGSYQVNVINNRPPAFCPYNESLPAGTNTWIRLYVPTADQLPDGEIFYATGSFEGANGGSDWSGGGNPDFAFTKVSETCFVLAVNFATDTQFKVTRGSWPTEAQDYNKSNFSNFEPNGKTSLELAIYDWADTDLDLSSIDPPSAGDEIPSGAIQPNQLTVTVEVSGYDVNDGKYYIVEEGATDTTGSVVMIPYANQNKLAASVPKANINYIVIKDSIEAVGTDDIGRIQVATWDGMTNPATFSVSSFEGGLTTLYMTGSATDGWAGGGDFPLNATEPGIYVNTFNVNGNSEYLILPNPSDWDNKWADGGTGDASSGTLLKGGPNNLNTNGLTTGTYTVTIDLTVDPPTYQLEQ